MRRLRKASRSSSLLDARAIGMRAAPTFSEAALWKELAGAKLGVRFRRQHPLLGRFIADFYAPADKLVIEVDGPVHSRREARDARRDRALARAGFRVLRLPEVLVLHRMPDALALIRAALRASR